MVSYNVIVSPKALEQLNEYIDYIQLTLLNNQAANSVWEDAIETINELEIVAGSLRECEHPALKEMGYHRILFKKHDYLMLYRIDGTTVYVEAVYHMLQDYENLFADVAREGDG